jgi:hypothetical protein
MDGKHKGFRPCARAQRRRNGGRKRLRRCGNVDDGASKATWRKCRPWFSLTEFIKRTWMNFSISARIAHLLLLSSTFFPSSSNHRHWVAAGSQFLSCYLYLLPHRSSDHNFRHLLCTLLVRASATSSLKSCKSAVCIDCCKSGARLPALTNLAN